MELLNTNSNYCKIAVQDNKKYIVKYLREYGVTEEYYRSTPESEVIELAQENNMKVPQILFRTDSYLVQEYINGTLLSDLYDDHKEIDRGIIDQIVSQICLMEKINAERLLRYTNWQDNSGFYQFQCQNTQEVFSITIVS